MITKRDARRYLVTETICKRCKRQFWGRVKQGRVQEFCSRSCSSSTMVGEKNGNWKGGIRKSNYDVKIDSEYKYPEKVKAREEANKALKLGVLVKRPCETCGDTKVE